MTLQIEKATLVVITNVRHYEINSRLYAAGPYTREIEPWAGLFGHVLIAGPFRQGPPPDDWLPFKNSNISIIPQKETGGRTFKDKLLNILNVPRQVVNLSKAMRKGEAIQVRCPGNLAFLGTILAPLISRNIIAIYAGQWNGYKKEPLSARIQRFLLRSWWWRNGFVTVLGEWPNQPKQIVPFFTSTMTAKQVQRGTEAANHKQLTSPAHFIFVGRLVLEKGVEVLLRAVCILKNQGILFHLSIIGDGPDRNRLSRMVEQLDLKLHVQFVGAIPYDDVMNWYEQAHVLVLPSQSEGFPKVLLEAMSYGVICMATDTGAIPWMLKDRGVVFPYGDVETLAAQLRKITENPVSFQGLSKAANEWACNPEYSIEGVQEALSRLLNDRWGEKLSK